jgi:hypothetical protein
MSVEQAFATYFNLLIKAWDALGSLPQMVLNEEADPRLHVDGPDEDEVVLWKPWSLDLQDRPDVTQVETQLGTTLHPSVRSYLSTYLFYALGGTYRGTDLQLDPVLRTDLSDFVKRFLLYADAHGGNLDYIPIGVEARRSLLVVVDNASGGVYLEDFERAHFEKLSESLADLIRELNP